VKLAFQPCLEEINFASSLGLDKTQMFRLADSSFIQRKENILITGAGKSFVASALGHLWLTQSDYTAEMISATLPTQICCSLFVVMLLFFPHSNLVKP
jgi:DNA replication protein DnaC